MFAKDPVPLARSISASLPDALGDIVHVMRTSVGDGAVADTPVTGEEDALGSAGEPLEQDNVAKMQTAETPRAITRLRLLPMPVHPALRPTSYRSTSRTHNAGSTQHPFPGRAMRRVTPSIDIQQGNHHATRRARLAP